MRRWRGRELTRELQVANACDAFVALAPVSDVAADAVKAAWLPMKAGQAIPLIGEIRYADTEDECP